MILKMLSLFLLLAICIKPQDNFPSWAKGIVWYQIFPERFANGDESNDPKPDKVFIRGNAPKNWKTTKWTSSWFERSEWEKELGGKLRNHINQRRYGGDIKGVIDHLDYLKELGVTGIYLNPVFEAVSIHKYDESTYHHIDVNFGPDPEGDKKLIASETPEEPTTWKWTSADKLFLKLIDEIHKRKMRLIIDGVFNHVGTEFWAFKDLRKNQDSSRYKDWFMVKKFDDPNTKENEFDYQGWWNNKGLPQFNRTETDLAAAPKQYIFYATHRWMDPNVDGDCSDGIDGWRLDVSRDVPLGFWKDWSSHVKKINPQAVIIGELWELSSDFVSENGPYDALMNYNFAFAVNNFFIADKKKISVSDFISDLQKIDTTYPDRNLDLLQNLLDSHDTDRLTSMIKNPDRNYDRDAKEGNNQYDPSKPGTRELNRQKLIAAFQMTYRGAPMIYYGDEAAIWGADDPHDRKPMLWSNLKYDDEVIDTSSGFSKGLGRSTVQANKEMIRYYTQLIALRNSNSALKEGKVEFIFSDSLLNAFAFERRNDEQRIICLFNNGQSAIKIKIPYKGSGIKYKELLSGKEGLLNQGILSASLKPYSAGIYMMLSANE